MEMKLVRMVDAVRFTEVVESLKSLKGDEYAAKAAQCASVLNLLKGAEGCAMSGSQEATLALLGMAVIATESVLEMLSGVSPADISAMRKALRADGEDFAAASNNPTNPTEDN